LYLTQRRKTAQKAGCDSFSCFSFVLTILPIQAGEVLRFVPHSDIKQNKPLACYTGLRGGKRAK
jgi:hypothetical protein